jgi:uncharacterized protein
MDIQACTAFEGTRCIASGSLPEVVKKVKKVIDEGAPRSILIFEDSTSELVEVDLRGTIKDVLRRLGSTTTSEASDKENAKQPGPGRPKLGVISREISLLPRHWDWLNAQPGGASVALRRLVEDARRINRDRDKIRRAQEVTYRFMSAMAGNMLDFEEAVRALFRRNVENFNKFIGPWPPDIRNHILTISAAVFQS